MKDVVILEPTDTRNIKAQLGYLIEMIEELETSGDMPDVCSQAEHVRDLLKTFLQERCNKVVED